ncbi:MAG: CoA transferase [Parvibaculum sp.]
MASILRKPGTHGQFIPLKQSGPRGPLHLVENFRPGVLERIGIGPEVLHQWNPDLVILRVSGYGQDGPMRKTPAFGRAAEAMSGLTHLTGFADGSPMHPGFPAADSTTGLKGALGIMIALFARERGTARGSRTTSAESAAKEYA